MSLTDEHKLKISLAKVGDFNNCGHQWKEK
jgi:hypothetical protein